MWRWYWKFSPSTFSLTEIKSYELTRSFSCLVFGFFDILLDTKTKCALAYKPYMHGWREFYENIFYAAFMMFEVNSQAYFSFPWKLHTIFKINSNQNIFSKIFIMFAFNHGLRGEEVAIKKNQGKLADVSIIKQSCSSSPNWNFTLPSS